MPATSAARRAEPAGRRDAWRRNVYAVTAASFIGFTGFTLVMPFLPLFIAQLGVVDVGQIALWTGFSLGITPLLTAVLAPAWGRLGDRYGRKIMVERSMFSFVVLMAATAFVTRAWHVLALRAVQGLFAGYGSLSVAMAAESAPRDRMPSAIGLVQTAQRLGPALGPVIGGALAGLVGLRRAFIATAACYLVGLLVVHATYDDAAVASGHAGADEIADVENLANLENPEGAANPANPAHLANPHRRAVSFRNVLAFENFMLMMGVIFGLQFVDRSFGPILPLYVEQVGVAHARVALVSGVLFSIMACAGALGHHFCSKLLKRYSTRTVIVAGAITAAGGSALFAASGMIGVMSVASLLFGLGVGAAMTASFSAAGSVIPPGAHGASFGVLTSASLIGMATSPFVAGLLGGTSIHAVFFLNLGVMLVVAAIVRQKMVV